MERTTMTTSEDGVAITVFAEGESLQTIVAKATAKAHREGVKAGLAEAATLADSMPDSFGRVIAKAIWKVAQEMG